MEIITIILFSPILLAVYLWQVATADWWQRIHLVMIPVVFFVAAGKAYLGVPGGLGAIVVSTPFMIWALRRI
jgi:hypothetical protein